MARCPPRTGCVRPPSARGILHAAAVTPRPGRGRRPGWPLVIRPTIAIRVRRPPADFANGAHRSGHASASHDHAFFAGSIVRRGRGSLVAPRGASTTPIPGNRFGGFTNGSALANHDSSQRLSGPRGVERDADLQRSRFATLVAAVGGRFEIAGGPRVATSPRRSEPPFPSGPRRSALPAPRRARNHPLLGSPRASLPTLAADDHRVCGSRHRSAPISGANCVRCKSCSRFVSRTRRQRRISTCSTPVEWLVPGGRALAPRSGPVPANGLTPAAWLVYKRAAELWTFYVAPVPSITTLRRRPAWRNALFLLTALQPTPCIRGCLCFAKSSRFASPSRVLPSGRFSFREPAGHRAVRRASFAVVPLAPSPAVCADLRRPATAPADGGAPRFPRAGFRALLLAGGIAPEPGLFSSSLDTGLSRSPRSARFSLSTPRARRAASAARPPACCLSVRFGPSGRPPAPHRSWPGLTFRGPAFSGVARELHATNCSSNLPVWGLPPIPRLAVQS